MIGDGIYTIVCAGRPAMTFQIQTQPATARFAPGRQIINWLIGGEGDPSRYELAGSVSECGLAPWERHKSTRVGVSLDVLWDLLSGEAVEGCRLTVRKN